MATKIITLPSHITEVTDERGKVVRTENTFLRCLSIVVEKTKHKNDTDTFLAHAVREKIDALNAQLTLELEEAKIDAINGQFILELEESEMIYINRGIDELRTDGISGTAWYWFIRPLREAVDKKVYERKQKVPSYNEVQSAISGQKKKTSKE